MLVSHYAPKIIAALFGGLFLFAGIYSFGNALLFDRLFIGVIIFAAVVCRKNINVLGVITLLILQRLIEESAWSISELDYQFVVKPLFYFIAIFACWKYWYDAVAKLLLCALLIAISAEFYWIIVAKSPPQIYWYVGLVVSNLCLRHFVFMRVSYTSDVFPKNAESINLDWHIHKLNGTASIIHFLMIVEYILRSVLNNNDILYVYIAYPYALQLLGTYLIWMVFYESNRMLLPKLLKV